MAEHPVDFERLGQRLFFAALRTLAALSFALAATAHATGPAIYKCLDNHLGLVYTDIPCKGGEKLDIRAGEPDSVAVARLERIRDQLDQSAIQHIMDERRAAALRIPAHFRREEEEQTPTAQYAESYAPFDYGYIAYPADMRHRPLHPRAHQPAQPRRFAPSPPYIVPKPAAR